MDIVISWPPKSRFESSRVQDQSLRQRLIAGTRSRSRGANESSTIHDGGVTDQEGLCMHVCGVLSSLSLVQYRGSLRLDGDDDDDDEYTWYLVRVSSWS